MSEKIIVSGVGYEGYNYNDTIEGETLGECLRELYIDVGNTYSDEEEFLEELDYILEDPKDSCYKWAKECKDNWDNADFWLKQIENMDCADFVLLSIYSTNLNDYYYKY